MFVQLIRHTFPDAPDWEVVDTTVPLGTQYEVLGYDRDMVMFDALTGRSKHVECFLLSGNGDVGFLPTCLFEAVEYERDNSNSRNPAN
jgi:hypothetical protein